MTLLSRYVISGKSMEPTFKSHDTVLVSCLPYLFSRPKINDIIALRDPRDKRILVKRITQITNNNFFVEGDNKQHTTDSREFGMIEKKDIIGKCLFT